MNILLVAQVFWLRLVYVGGGAIDMAHSLCRAKIFLFTAVIFDTLREHERQVGNPAVSSQEIRGFPTPPHDGCGFTNFLLRPKSEVYAHQMSLSFIYIIRHGG